jgi:hypothetical protein
MVDFHGFSIARFDYRRVEAKVKFGLELEAKVLNK